MSMKLPGSHEWRILSLQRTHPHPPPKVGFPWHPHSAAFSTLRLVPSCHLKRTQCPGLTCQQLLLPKSVTNSACCLSTAILQVCGGYPDAMSRLCQLASEHISCDFVDLNCGCPIDIICARQAGSALLTKPRRFEEVVRSASAMLDVPLIVKMR